METMAFRSFDMSFPIALECGCLFTRLFDWLAVAGYQIMTGHAVVCPYHAIPHQFSRDALFLRTAIMVWQLKKQLNGEPVNVRYEMNSDTYFSVTHPSLPIISLVKE